MIGADAAWIVVPDLLALLSLTASDFPNHQ